MSKFFKRATALVLAFVLSFSLCCPALAADETNTEGLTFSASFDKAAVETSDQAQTVVLTVKANKAFATDGLGFTVDAGGLTIKSIKNSEFQVNGNTWNATVADGIVTSATSDAENLTIGTIAEVEIEVPANCAPGTYSIGVKDLVITRDYGESVEDGANAYATFTVKKAPVSLSSVGVKLTAPEINKAPVTTATAEGTGYTVSAVTWSPAADKFAAKAYTATVTVTAKDGYFFNEATTATINGKAATVSVSDDGSKMTVSYQFAAPAKLQNSITASDVTATYGDTNKKIAATATGGALSYAVKSGADVVAVDAKTGALTIKKAGTAVITVTAAADDFYAAATKDVKVTVDPKTVTVTVDAIAAQTYTGKAITPAVKVTSSVDLKEGTDYTVAYKDNINAGTASVTVSPVAGSNYTFTAVTKTFEIKPAAITITAKNQSSLVNNPAPTLEGQYTVSGLLGSDKLVKEPTVAYEKTPNTTVAGTYKINVSGADAGKNYTITYVPGTLTISNKQVQTLTVTTPVDVTFGDNSKTLSATSNVSGASIKFAVKAGAEDVLAVTADGKLTPKKVGTAKILVTAEETATYGAAEAEIVVNVVPKQITAPAADTTKFVYTGEAQTYGIAATADYTVTGATQTAAGTYKVTVALKDKTNTTWADGKTADLTFDFVIEKAAITVPTAPTATYTYTGEAQTYGIKTDAAYTVTGATQTNAGSYTVTVALKDKTNTTWADGKTADLTYTFVIAKAAITITADDKAILIDEEVPAPTYTVSGLCGTEKLTKEPTVAYEGEVDNTAEGTYAIVVSGAEASDNYTITYVNGTLTISEEEEDENGSVPNPPAHDCAIVKFLDCDPYLWYHEGIDYVVNNGLMNGVSTGKFAPNANTTRAMIVTILWRLEGEPAAADASFTDVADGQWYSEAIDWASANGIVNGYSAAKFGPMDSITREQMAAILYRYADMKGYDMQAGAALNFADAGSVSSYATAAMQWAVAEGLINGVGDNTLNPQGTATRAQVATILMRFCENVAK